MYYQASPSLPALWLGRNEKVLALLIIVSLILQPLVALIPPRTHYADVTTQSTPISTTATPHPALRTPHYSLPEELVGKPEVPTLRTLDSATFDLGNGHFARYQDAAPLHFQDANGDWQPINPAYEQLAGRWVNNTNTVRTILERSSSAATISAGGVNVQWQPQTLEAIDADGSARTLATVREDAQPAVPSADGRSVRYAQSWTADSAFSLLNLVGGSAPKIADQWQSSPGQAEYTMRLTQLPNVCGFRFVQCDPQTLDVHVNLTLQPGTTLLVDNAPITRNSQLITRNSLTFRDANGGELLLHPPHTYEQANPESVVDGEYVITVGDNPAQIELRVRTPWAWLAAPERQFPVIIDPLFQMRRPFLIAEATYDPATNFGYKDLRYVNDRLYLGRGNAFATRAALRFDIPPMPPGTEIDKAWLYAVPSGYKRLSFTNVGGTIGEITAYEIQNDQWFNGPEPAVNLDNPLPPGEQLIAYSSGQKTHGGVKWDVTTQARNWLPIYGSPFSSNNGILLRLKNEFCDPNGILFLPDTLFCGGLEFDAKLDAWAKDPDLENTQVNGTPDDPQLLRSESGGIRLVVFYHNGATLKEVTPDGQNVVTFDVSGASLPQGMDKNPPYYYADHLYTVAQPPAKWQAVTARSFGKTTGVFPPTQPGVANAYKRPLNGKMSLDLRSNNDSFSVRNATSGEGEASYLLINGRGDPSPLFQQNLPLRTTFSPKATGSLSDVTGYDLRLIGESGDINAPLNAMQVINYEFDSADPLALWNLQLPSGSNAMVRIQITNDGTRPESYMQAYGDQFQAKVIRTTSVGDVRSSAFDDITTVAPKALNPNQAISIDLDNVQAAEHALAIQYNGPQLTVRDVEECGKEFCETKVIPIKYVLHVEVLACAAGSFPTNSGHCQAVVCPNITSLVANYRETDDYGMWSNSAWSGADESVPVASVVGDTAPLLGPRKNGSTFRAMSVAVIGGKVTYNKSTRNITISSEVNNEQMPAKVRLVQCPTPGANTQAFSKSFNVFDGKMSHPSLLGNGFRPNPAGSGQIQADPWPISDRQGGDISAESFVVTPAATSTAVGIAAVRRVVGKDVLVNLSFNANWTFTADGWPTLSSAISAKLNNPAPPDFASLLVALGDQLALDVSAVNGDAARVFTGIRAKAGTVTQQAQLGGASKPVQVVVLPRGVAIPIIDVLCPASCMDLRGPTDAAGQSIPDRIWAMPDVHTNVDAKTVVMNSAGVMQVYSTDHPDLMGGAQGAIGKEFSFDAFKASVSVDYTQCGGVGPDVWVITGDTTMALPNIGAAGAGGGISAGFTLCETSLRSVRFSFESPVGVPIGNSGLFLTGLRGAVDIYPDYTQIKVGLNFQAAPGGDGGVFKAYGEVTIDTRGLFEFGGGGTVLGVVDADGRLWVAWNPLDTGFEINVRLGSWFRGFARAHMWQGQGWQNRYSWLPDNNEMHFAGEIGATITIEESAVMWLVPPGDIEIGIEVAFGQFCTNGGCTHYEWGVKGKIVVVGYDVGVYYGFDEGLDFILGNDDHLLIDEYGSQIVAAGAMGVLNVGVAPQKIDATATIPFAVSSSAEQILVGTSWQAGAPILSLIDPDGVEITVDNVAAHNGASDGSANITLFGLQQPKPGAWQAKLSNLSAEGVEHYHFLYFANKGAPGAPGNHGKFLTPAAADEPGTNSYNITWEVPTDVTAPATISLFYDRTISNTDSLAETGYITGNLLLGAPIVQNLAFSAGSFQWNTNGLLNGSYRIRAVVDDGVNDLDNVSIPDNVCLPQPNGLPTARAFDPNRFPGTVNFTSPGTVLIDDTTPPPPPSGLSAAPADSALLVQWDATSDPDVSAYLVRWGLRRPDALPQGFLVQKQQLVAAPNGAQAQFYLVAVDNGKQYGVDVTALDINGNASSPVAAIFATPDAAADPIPLLPVNLIVTGADSTSASFAWEADPNGPVPASYRLSYIKLSKYAPSGQMDAAGSPATLADLETGATYDVQVAALNGAGWASAPTERVRVVISNGVDGNGDGLPDDWATANDVSDGNADDDGDGLNNAAEFNAGTNPHDQDSDNDDASDGEEQIAGTDPLDGSEFAGGLTQPRLSLARDTLRFTAKQQPGGEAAPQSVQWINQGGGNLQLQASSADAWIAPTIAGDQVQVALDTSSLLPGFHSGVVQLKAAPGSDPAIGDQRCIRVNAWVLPADDDIPPTPKQDQTINFAPLADKLLDAGPVNLSATASSGLPVSFASNTPDVCTVVGEVVTLVGLGTCSISAVQAGDATFNPASNVTRTFQVIDPANPFPYALHLPVIANSK